MEENTVRSLFCLNAMLLNTGGCFQAELSLRRLNPLPCSQNEQKLSNTKAVNEITFSLKL